MANSLISGYESGRITAQDLVETAITMNRLSSNALSKAAYLDAVDRQLTALVQSERGAR